MPGPKVRLKDMGTHNPWAEDNLQEGLDPSVKAKDVYLRDGLSLVSAALMYFAYTNKLHQNGTLNTDEMRIYTRCRNWWLGLDSRKRDVIYEMAFQYAHRFEQAEWVLG
jgi:hypothetical protein